MKHAGSRVHNDHDDRCPCAECGLVGSATLARDLEQEEVHESVPLERALVLEESGGPCGAAQPAQSPRAEWSTIPTPTFETLVVGSAVANDAMGAPENTRLPVRPSLNPWSTTERKWYLASLPSDGVIEHRAIIAPRTPAARAPPGKGGAGRGGACGVVDDSSKLGVRRSGARGRRCCLSEGQAPLLGGIRPGSGAAVSARSRGGSARSVQRRRTREMGGFQ